MSNLLKKAFVFGVAITSPMLVQAKSATMSVVGPDKVNVDDTFTVNINVSDILDAKDGIVAIGSDIIYDSNTLELVSAKAVNDNYGYQNHIINSAKSRFVGIDTTLTKGIKNSTNVYSYTFKALKDGNATIKLDNIELVDSDADELDYLINNKNITIESAKQEVVEVLEEKENKVEELPKVEKTTNASIIKEENNTQLVEEVKDDNSNVNETKVVELTNENTENKKSIGSFFAELISIIFNSIFKW